MSDTIARLYREALKRQPAAAGLDAAELQALADGGVATEAVLDRLSREPEAKALLAFSRELSQESKLLALELKRADAVARSWARPRRRRVALAAAAALAALAFLLPQAVMEGQLDLDGAMTVAPMQVDGDVILASSFERNGVGSADQPDSGNGNASIFTSRFDG